MLKKLKVGLNRNDIRFLRKTQQELLAEPRRFDMKYGIVPAHIALNLIEAPPCDTACCIGGTMYCVAVNFKFNKRSVDWNDIVKAVSKDGINMYDPIFSKLFYIKSVHGFERGDAWPEFYETMYLNAKTPLQRAVVGVARIEHFIQTDGRE